MARNTLAPGGYIGGEPPRRPYFNQLSGVWKLEDAMERQRAGTWANPLGIEDLFSTYLYTGNGSTQTITNGIDLSGKGGLVWIKRRDASGSNYIFDSAQSAFAAYLVSNATSSAASFTPPNWVTATTTGFNLDSNWGTAVNGSGQSMASWTFRKAAKFFDIVTYTGDGTSGRAISHNLGSTPGCVIIKRTDGAGNWLVHHRGTPGGITGNRLYLNTTAATVSSGIGANATSITLFNSLSEDNINGGTYVAYLFAHDAGGFGDSGNESVVKCGSYTGNGSASGPTVTLGWEPQWLIIKRTDATNNWELFDNMRGFVVGGPEAELRPNSSNAEFIDTVSTASPLPTGFQLDTTDAAYNASGGTYIYIAIRRGPMKTPTDATKVFSAVTKSADNTFTSTNHVVDLLIESKRTSVSTTYQHLTLDRLRGTNALTTFSTAAEYAGVVGNWFSSNTGFNATNFYAPTTGDYLFWAFRRAPGFFDVVAYTSGVGNTTFNHNLGVTPELLLLKTRSNANDWYVYSKSLANPSNYYLVLNTTAAQVDVGATQWTVSSTQVTVGPYITVNGYTNIAYLFASCPGVSKVGSYTGTGTTLNVDCGFTAGARFVLIKRTDSTGDWYVWDTARGIVSGNDPYLLLNSTAAEVTSTDYIDPLNAGFQISSTAPAAINANGGTYIYLSVA